MVRSPCRWRNDTGLKGLSDARRRVSPSRSANVHGTRPVMPSQLVGVREPQRLATPRGCRTCGLGRATAPPPARDLDRFGAMLVWANRHFGSRLFLRSSLPALPARQVHLEICSGWPRSRPWAVPMPCWNNFDGAGGTNTVHLLNRRPPAFPTSRRGFLHLAAIPRKGSGLDKGIATRFLDLLGTG